MLRPTATPLTPLPPGWLTPEQLAQLAAVIASGVTDVKYADREVKYAAIGDLLKAFQWVTDRLVPGAGLPRRAVASFSKGLPPTSPAWLSGAGGREHAECWDRNAAAGCGCAPAPPVWPGARTA